MKLLSDDWKKFEERTYSERVGGSVPVLGKGIPNVPSQVVNDNLGSVTLIAVFVKLEPRDFVALLAEYWVMGSSLFARCQFTRFALATDVDDVDLQDQ